jgi:hypothetical protein
VRGFDRVEVPGSWEIEVTEGRFAVSVTVDDNLADELRVERRGDALVFRLRDGIRLGRSTLRGTVSMPELSGVAVSGSGSIEFDGFRGGDLDLVVSGSGQILGANCAAGKFRATVSGSGAVRLSSCTVIDADLGISGSGTIELMDGASCRGDRLSLRISGSGDADLSGCTFGNVDLALSGSGDASLLMSDGNLGGSISGSGSIRYSGDPQTVDVRTSGSGRVVKEG